MYFGLIGPHGYEVTTPGYNRIYAGDYHFKMSPGSAENEVIFINVQPLMWRNVFGIVERVAIFRDADSPTPFFSAPLDTPILARPGDAVIVGPGRLQIVQVFDLPERV